MLGRAYVCTIAACAMAVLLVSAPATAGVRIYRDVQGVPQIYADSNRELFYGFGYLIGKDRLFQVEMRKYQALGRRAEILGRTDQPSWANKFVEKDEETRRTLDLHSLQEQDGTLTGPEQQLLQAYVDGLNQAIREALEDDGAGLPHGFQKYGFVPTEWTVLDLLATATDVLAGYSDFSFQDSNLVLYRFLAQKYPQSCDDVFDQLLWLQDPYAVTTMGDQLAPNAVAAPTPSKGCRATEGAMPNGLALAGETRTFAQKPGPHFEPRRASMAWAVGRDRTADHGTLFLSGPQTGWHRPSYYYTVGLHGGDFDFIGMAPEAMPVFQVGFNRHYAWGMTAGLGTQSDLYELTLAEDGTGYMRNGEETPFDEHVETINVKNDAPVEETVLNSHYGPVMEIDHTNHRAYAKFRPWRGYAISSLVNWIEAARATSRQEWRDRVDNIAFNYNLFYADNTGTVGFAFTGRFADRAPGVDPRLPIKGDGTNDVTGYTAPGDTLVHFTQGTMFNFNNRPRRSQPNSGLFWEQWSRGNQVEILNDAIAQWGNNVTWQDVWNLNRTISYTDVNWYPFHRIFQMAVQNLDPNDPLYDAAQAVLQWNGERVDENSDGHFDSVGLTIFDRWLEDLVRRTLGPTFDGAGDAGAGGVAGYYLRHVHQRLPARLEEHPSGGTLTTYRAYLAATGAPGVANHHDFFGGEDPMEVAREALSDAVGQLSQKYGNDDVSTWLTDTTPQSYFPSNTDRMPMSDTAQVTNHGVYANRGAVNLVVEYGENGGIERAGFANPLGGPEDQSADAPSDFHLDLYGDQGLAPLHLVNEQTLIQGGAQEIANFQ